MFHQARLPIALNIQGERADRSQIVVGNWSLVNWETTCSRMKMDKRCGLVRLQMEKEHVKVVIKM